MAAVVGITAALVVGVAAPASAHNQIISSTPSSGQTLTVLPAKFEIDTNNVLLDIGGTGRGFAFEIRDAAGKYYEDGCISIVDDNMSTAARLGAPGAYTVVFQIISADGHTVSGEIPFTWAPSAASTVTKGVADPPGCGGTKGPAAAAPPAGNGGSEATRTTQVPLADVLWIGGILVALAIAIIVTLVVVTRRRRADGDAEANGDAKANADTDADTGAEP